MNPPILPRQFLFVGVDPDSRDLLVMSLRQQFKHITVLESTETGDALEIVACQAIDAVIIDRTDEDGAVELVQWFHALDPTLPLIVVAWNNRGAPAVLKAGAKAFLSYDQWSSLGTLVLHAVLSRLPKPGKIPDSLPSSSTAEITSEPASAGSTPIRSTESMPPVNQPNRQGLPADQARATEQV